MVRIETSQDLSKFLDKSRNKGSSHGFVPTMGALHEGHFSLVSRSKRENDITIASIFVNPTQFDEKEDLERYPKTLEADCKNLKTLGCDVVFIPNTQEVYPHGMDYQLKIDLDGLDTVMEGQSRPGHFKGVVQVVKRLLELVDCDRLYMGQKDFQQFTIIKYMLEYFSFNTELKVCPTLREEDGLAMSSRNRFLPGGHRKKASLIFRVLNQAKGWIGKKPIQEIQSKCFEYLDVPPIVPEYFEIVNGHNLSKITSANDSDLIVACTAVRLGSVRLIDNMVLTGKL